MVSIEFLLKYPVCGQDQFQMEITNLIDFTINKRLSTHGLEYDREQ